MQKSAVSLIFITILLGGIILSIALMEKPFTKTEEPIPLSEFEIQRKAWLTKDGQIITKQKLTDRPLIREDYFGN
jgi:hypothetical protein